METGKFGVDAMALLDKANTATYGNPEISKVNIGVRSNPGILISGHDLKDMEELLKQTEGTGIDVYTHSEMLPANYYPAFKKYTHFVGNYGNAWWKQTEDRITSYNVCYTKLLRMAKAISEVCIGHWLDFKNIRKYPSNYSVLGERNNFV